MSLSKSEVYYFLVQFEKNLKSRLPDRPTVRSWVETEQATRKAQNAISRLKHPNSIKENAFINGFLIKPLAYEVQSYLQISVNRVPEFLRAESYLHYPELMGAKCARAIPHPFSKKYGESAQHTLKRWRGQVDKENPVLMAWPDFALTEPFNVICEAKFFQGKKGAAESEIVNGLYETFYYLSMPAAEAAGDYPDWHYDYGCYIAFDSSDEKSLKLAWKSL